MKREGKTCRVSSTRHAFAKDRNTSTLCLFSTKQAFDLAAEFIKGAIKVHVTEAVHALVHDMRSVFSEAAETLLNVFEQAKSAMARWWRSQRTDDKDREESETCCHKQRAAWVLANVVLCLGSGFVTGGKGGLNGGSGI